MDGAIPVIFWPGIVIAFALLFAFSWILVRHIGLALLMALSPLPGLALGAGASPLLGYFPGFIAGSFLAGAIAGQVANTSARPAAWQSFRDLWPVFLIAFLLLVPVAFVITAPLGFLIGDISAVAITFFGTMFLSFDENFVVRINRANERYLRQIERLHFLTEPRWGMSIGGIALVFAVLGFFGTPKAAAALFVHPVLFGGMALIFLIGAVAVTRNIRRALAAVLGMISVALLAAAAANRLAIPSSGLLLPSATAATLILFGAASARSSEQNGDGWETATLRGLERFGPAIVIASIASAGAAVFLLTPSATLESVALLLGGMAALILQPALTTMLYALFPKRVSLEDAFRRR